jgi:predicted nucleic acid-binding OB-fold protein
MEDIEAWFEKQRLHRAAGEGNLTAVQEFIAQGCPVNAFDDLGKTPLHYAVISEHFSVMDYLLQHGANINANDERTIGETPFADAISTCSLRMARHLEESGADPTIRGWMWLTALDRAKTRKKSEGIGSDGQAVYEFLREAVRRKKDRR